MISAKALQILGSGSPQFWRWISLPDSRFEEVAELLDFLWLEITGKIATWILSPSSLYKAYLVFKLTDRAYGFRSQPVKVKVIKKSYEIVLGYWHRILGMHASHPQEIDEAPYPRERADGWLEIDLGEFSYERDDELLKMSCKENSCGGFKGGLIVQGIENLRSDPILEKGRIQGKNGSLFGPEYGTGPNLTLIGSNILLV
ncbi:hypothetical protein ABKV19_007425 [Rosa sericea]